MSLSMALSSALSGLHLSARGTQLVADNIANAQTEGYAIRTLSQAARVTGAEGSGVMATGIHRAVDRPLLSELRNATSQENRDDTKAAFWAKMEAALGMPDEPGGLTKLIDSLGLALQRAVAAPDSPAALLQVSQTATELSLQFVSLQQHLQQQRDAADSALAKDVGFINQALEEIAKLNREIQSQTLSGGAPQGLMDARQRLVDQVAVIVPIRELARDDGRIMLVAQDGTVLVDREAAHLAFSRTRDPAPNEFVEDGALSRISLNGRDISSSSPMFDGGRLGALLHIRDVAAPAVQHQLDQLASDLVLRFMGSDIDPSLPPDAFGLFALKDHISLPAERDGIAGQLVVNPLVDPDKGGDVWRLRAGLQAAGPGMVFDNAQLDRMARALGAGSVLPDGSGPVRSLQGHSADMLSVIASERLHLDRRAALNMARVTSLRERFAAGGVDTDAELSKLLVLEQAYSANARVLATVDKMLRTLLEI